MKAEIITHQEAKNIVSTYCIDVDYAYPIPSLKRDDSLLTIKKSLESFSIYSIGRFGAWKYEFGNMDHSVIQGVKLIDKLLNTKSDA